MHGLTQWRMGIKATRHKKNCEVTHKLLTNIHILVKFECMLFLVDAFLMDIAYPVTDEYHAVEYE